MTLNDLPSLELDAFTAIEAALDEATLRDVEVQLLGKKGSVTGLVKSVAEAPKEERAELGKRSNLLKKAVTEAIDARRSHLRDAAIRRELDDRTFDITLPGTVPAAGTLHPLTLVQERLEEIVTAMGFTVLDYPEVEDEWHNFEALNIPADHPARDSHDTFWLHPREHKLLLRTHTSPGQIRAMKETVPPFRALFPGKVFRYEAVDASHEHTFHQIEGLFVDRDVSVANLIHAMTVMLGQIFSATVEQSEPKRARTAANVKVRLRPGYFPFVEPGFELDMSCLLCGGTGCKVCKQSGWVETLGCGLVHPSVLRAAGLDTAEWQAWAFGIGLSRIVMMQYGIDDIRHLMGGDLRFLRQFR